MLYRINLHDIGFCLIHIQLLIDLPIAVTETVAQTAEMRIEFQSDRKILYRHSHRFTIFKDIRPDSCYISQFCFLSIWKLHPDRKCPKLEDRHTKCFCMCIPLIIFCRIEAVTDQNTKLCSIHQKNRR